MLLSGHGMQVYIDGNNIMGFQRYGLPILFPGQQVIYDVEGKPVEKPSVENIGEGWTIKPRRTHPCFPIFGASPKNCPGIPQHGWLRDATVTATTWYAGDNHLKIYTTVGGDHYRDYPWRIQCKVIYFLGENSFRTIFELDRQDKLSSDAPFNLGMHWYWMNAHGIRAELPGFEMFFQRTQKSSKHFPWEDPRVLGLELCKVCKIKLTMESQKSQGEREIVAWSDDPRFFCFEQVLDRRENFGKKKGLHLEQGEEYRATFTIEFEDL